MGSSSSTQISGAKQVAILLGSPTFLAKGGITTEGVPITREELRKKLKAKIDGFRTSIATSVDSEVNLRDLVNWMMAYQVTGSWAPFTSLVSQRKLVLDSDILYPQCWKGAQLLHLMDGDVDKNPTRCNQILRGSGTLAPVVEIGSGRGQVITMFLRSVGSPMEATSRQTFTRRIFLEPPRCGLVGKWPKSIFSLPRRKPIAKACRQSKHSLL